MERLIEQFKATEIKEELSSPLVQWAGLLCLIILIWWAMIKPYYAWRAENLERLQTKIAQLERLERLERSRESIDQYAELLKQHKTKAEQALIDSRTHSRALGMQVEFFDRIYRPMGIKFTGRRFGEPGMQPWLGEKVNSQWRLSGSSDEMLAILYGVANTKEILEPLKIEIKKGVQKRGESTATYDMSIEMQSYRKLTDAQLKAESR
ncbi:hypothetical protein KW419_10745 [Vibrio fluvialis]|uniref:hypothetical protein n=1 Tax=Vibrio fluvialis TaxID=676 RepID=UPI001C9D5DD1|nr:hypothetical protein [Vibrio fluvialis]MBY7924259.1 hypothetical protein [Vibrio fluvialis]MBY7980061.1 hypothetical protein [Vibrio fluvialis]MBY8232503.1 hypothetical protein [Vibrio fluvialis]